MRYGNPYAVTPLGGLNLPEAVGGMMDTRRGRTAERAAAEQVMQIRQQAADLMAANDHAGLRQLTAQYPDLLKGYSSAIQWTNEQSKPIYTGWLEAISRAKTPEEAQRITQSAIAGLRAAGAPTDRIESDYARLAGMAPEQWQAEALSGLLMADPERYDKATAQPDEPEMIREFKAWQQLPDSPGKQALGIEKGFVQQDGTETPVRFMSQYGEDAGIAQEAYALAGGGKDGLKAAQTAVDNLREQRAEETRKEEGRTYVRRARDLVTRLLRNPELDDVIGAWEGEERWWRPRSDREAEAITDISEIQSILTSENMDLMTGVLSESDIKLLKELSAGALQRKRTEGRFRKDAQELLAALSREIGMEPPAPAPTAEPAGRGAGFRGRPPAAPQFLIKEVR